MRKITLLLIAGIFFSSILFSQTNIYTTSGGEMIFSFATIDDNGEENTSVIRWAPVFNFQGMLNADFNEHVGVFTGLALRNVGYIYDNYRFMENDVQVKVKKKFRTYNLGLPIGIKIGNMNKAFIYGGYDVEFPIHYKEKTFRDEKKTKFSAWFSNRVEQFQHGFMVGIQFPYGGNLKFKYYVSSFHNTDYTEANGNKPYQNLNSNIFYFSLNFNLFKNADLYYKEGGENKYL